MNVLFDIRNKTHWAEEINNKLREYEPKYIQEFGAVGSPQWWDHKANYRIKTQVYRGVVTYVGPRTDDFSGEVFDVVELKTEDETMTFDYMGYLTDPRVQVNAQLVFEYFEITIHEKYGPHTFKVELKATVEA